MASPSREKAQLLPSQLGKIDLKSICIANSPGFTDTPREVTGSDLRTSSVSPQSEGISCDIRGDIQDEGEKCYKGGQSEMGPVYQSPLSHAKKGRQNSTSCDQFKEIEHVCDLPTLQDGGTPSLNSARGLHDQIRSEGCLFQCKINSDTS